jgi:hypothetical protein
MMMAAPPLLRRRRNASCGGECARGSGCLGGRPDVEGRLKEDVEGAQGALPGVCRLEGLPPARRNGSIRSAGAREERRRGVSGRCAVKLNGALYV